MLIFFINDTQFVAWYCASYVLCDCSNKLWYNAINM